MDEGKQSEESWEEPERLGPYLLQEQVPQSDDSQGKLYLATHEPSGTTALLLKLARKGAATLMDLRGLVNVSASLGFIAMHVEHTPWSRAPDRQSVESAVFTFEGLHEAMRRMARAVSDTPEPCPRWRLGLALASVAAVGTLLFALVQLTSESPPPNGPEPLADTPPVLTSDDALWSAGTPDDPFASGTLVDTSDAGDSVPALPLPREPFKGQKRPPCTRYAEVELIGACWTPHRLKAPCPDVLYEYQGECYVPAFSAKPPPQSVGQ